MLVGTFYNLVNIADFGMKEPSQEELQACAYELWNKDPTGEYNEMQVTSYLTDLGLSRFKLTLVIVTAHLLAVFLHYAN